MLEHERSPSEIRNVLKFLQDDIEMCIEEDHKNSIRNNGWQKNPCPTITQDIFDNLFDYEKENQFLAVIIQKEKEEEALLQHFLETACHRAHTQQNDFDFDNLSIDQLEMLLRIIDYANNFLAMLIAAGDNISPLRGNTYQVHEMLLKTLWQKEGRRTFAAQLTAD